MTKQHERQNEKARDQFTKQAEAYAALTRGSRDVTLGGLLEAVRPVASDTALDVGCGPGSLTLPLARVCGHITGLDLTQAMIEEAKAQQAEQGIANADFQLGDALPLPFADGAYSLVVTRATFHHLAEPARVLAEMVRVAAPGGRIAVIDLTPEASKADAFNEIETLRDPSHVRAFTPEGLRALGAEAGLTELACQSLSQALPLEAVLATSFPAPGDMDKVRARFRADAESGADRYGMAARLDGATIMITYPMTLIAFRRAA